MSTTLLRKGVVHPERERMEERSLRQCEGDWRPNGEKERVREGARAREENVQVRVGRTSGG